MSEKKDNLDPYGQPKHRIVNDGNVAVMVDIGYMPSIPEGIRPGLEPGLDVFSTLIGSVPHPSIGPGYEIEYTPLPPGERIPCGYIHPAGSGIKGGWVGSCPLALMYCAPTGLSESVQGMRAGYEIRAYPPVYLEPIDPPIYLEPLGE